MSRTIEGNLAGGGLKFAVVVARFNEFITGKLLQGAMDAFLRHGVEADDIDTVWVPGAFEIPLAAKYAAQTGRYSAVICLGAIIRGGTPHWEYISAEVTKGVAAVGMDTNVPAIFGVITAETIEQAIERAGTKAGNKGFDAAMSAIEMANLVRNLKDSAADGSLKT